MNCAWCGAPTRFAATMRGPDGRFGFVAFCAAHAPPNAPLGVE